MPATCPQCSAELPARAAYCPRCGRAVDAAAGENTSSGGLFGSRPASEPEFRRWRRRFYTRQVIFCALAVPVGLLFLRVDPAVTLIVSGLGLLGLIVGLARLAGLSET